MKYIYGLRDPITKEIRYIGKTSDPHVRWLAHCCVNQTDIAAERRAWLTRLKRRKLAPEFIVLCVTEDRDAGEVEMAWIERARAEGWPLFNKQGFFQLSVLVKCHPSEHDKWKAAAKRAHCSLGDWLRRTINTEAEKVP